jgi:transcriptional regulator with PAS, ATPase and Fis domain
MESEIFGYERGAFTGATQKRRGKFQLANKGTLFLDEIGDMSLYMQSKLLRVLQDGTFSPLGSENEVKSNAWVIAATNKNLELEIQNKNFRQDLFYRLNTINIHITPLRERPEDIPLLIKHYFNIYKKQLNRPKTYTEEITVGVLEKMIAYSWPGNVRELQNLIKRIVIFGCNDETVGALTTKHDERNDSIVNQEKVSCHQIEKDTLLGHLQIDNFMSGKRLSLKEITKIAVEKAERRVILDVLNKTSWNRKKATKILNVSYPALLYKMKDLNIYPN